MNALELSGVAVQRGGRPILRDVDLEVPTGQAVAVLGANGSGKSTLVRALLGLTPVSAGRVRLFDTPLADFHQWQRVGYVPQRAGAPGGVPVSVREVVASGRLSRRTPFLPMRAADRTAIAGAIAATGLSDRARHSVATLSGGQQQRVLIARTLASEPDLLVLDEPNAGVDLASQEQIAETIGARTRAGATVLVVLHELGPFEPLLDRVVMLRDGRISYDGPPQDFRPEARPWPAEHHHPDHEPAPALPVVPGPEASGPLGGDR